MKNKEGFTLIELLAVIVVLAVVVVITAPVISNSIENSKKNGAIESAGGLIEAAEYYFVTTSPRYGKLDVLNEKLNYKGEKPELGEVEIDKQGKSRIYAYINGYCVTKEYGSELYASKIDKENCNWYGTDNYETTEGTTFTLNNQSVKNYLIYGNSTQATRSGKNLFNPSAWSTAVTGNGLTVQYLKDQDCFLINGTATATASLASKYINIPNEVNTSYVLSTQYVSGSIDRTNAEDNKWAVAYFGNGDEINTTNNWYGINMQNSNVNNSAKTNSKSYITRFWFYVSKGVTFNNYKVRIQLEKGTSATTYEEYGTMPSPEFPSEIKSVGDLLTSSNCSSYGSDACNNVDKYVIQVKSVGKNLFNYDKASSPMGTKQDNGYYSKYSTNMRFYTYEALEKYLGKTVTISFDLTTGEDGTFQIYQYQGNGIGIKFDTISKEMKANQTQRITLTGVVQVLNTVSSYSKGEIIVYKNGYTGTYLVNNIQMEEGSTATTYEAYKEKLTNIYLDEPLRKVGDYADYIDFNNKKVVRYVKEDILMGTETISRTDDGRFSYRFKDISGNGLCNYYKTSYYKQDGTVHLEYTVAAYFSDTRYNTAEEFKNMLASQYNLGNPVKIVWYRRDKQIFSEEIVDLPNIELLDGTSTLLINTSVQPSNIKLTTNK